MPSCPTSDVLPSRIRYDLIKRHSLKEVPSGIVKPEKSSNQDVLYCPVERRQGRVTFASCEQCSFTSLSSEADMYDMLPAAFPREKICKRRYFPRKFIFQRIYRLPNSKEERLRANRGFNRM